jgi:hypothetical protein
MLARYDPYWFLSGWEGEIESQPTPRVSSIKHRNADMGWGGRKMRREDRWIEVTQEGKDWSTETDEMTDVVLAISSFPFILFLFPFHSISLSLSFYFSFSFGFFDDDPC